MTINPPLSLPHNLRILDSTMMSSLLHVLLLLLTIAVLSIDAVRRYDTSAANNPPRQYKVDVVRHSISSKPIPPRRRSVYPSTSTKLTLAFGSPKYYTNKYIPADQPGVQLKVPNFDALFDEICKVSPLAKQALMEDKPGGIAAIDSTADVYKWKETDNNTNRLVSHIDKIDNFQKKNVPLLRFRSSLTGPSNTKQRAICFSELISTVDLRQRWDNTNNIVDTIYNAANLKELEDIQDHKYGELALFGIGYVKTKQSVVSPREQLTLCGLQHFPKSGAAIVWGIELEEDQNNLFPQEQTKRQPRSTSHLFSTTLIPTGENTFDVEYVLQVEIGGFPGWLTGPVVAETVKKMFTFADGYFKSGLEEDGELAKRMALFPKEEDEKEKADGGDAATDITLPASLKDVVEEVTKEYKEVVEPLVEEVTKEFKKLGKRARVKKLLKKIFRIPTFDKYT